MLIREFIESDLEELQMIYLKVRKDTFPWLDTSNYKLGDFDNDSKGESIYVAVEADIIMGFISMWEPDNFVHLLFVASDYQSQGVGKKLLDYVKNLCDKPLALKCKAKNTKAINFYKKNNFIVESEGIHEDDKYFYMVCKNK